MAWFYHVLPQLCCMFITLFCVALLFFCYWDVDHVSLTITHSHIYLLYDIFYIYFNFSERCSDPSPAREVISEMMLLS